MKIEGITNVEGFFAVVDDCIGSVELLTDEGDRLNLKSKLCQYISMAALFSDNKVKNLNIVTTNEEDEEKIREFLENDD